MSTSTVKPVNVTTQSAGYLLQQPWLSFLVTLVCDQDSCLLQRSSGAGKESRGLGLQKMPSEVAEVGDSAKERCSILLILLRRNMQGYEDEGGKNCRVLFWIGRRRCTCVHQNLPYYRGPPARLACTKRFNGSPARSPAARAPNLHLHKLLTATIAEQLKNQQPVLESGNCMRLRAHQKLRIGNHRKLRRETDHNVYALCATNAGPLPAESGASMLER